MDKYWKQFQNCLQKEAPFCTNVCPFHLDVLDFQAKIARGSYNAAYKTLRNAVAFPEIVASLCPEYCASVCPRKDVDQAVQLHLLEKTCAARATKKEPTDYNVPAKEGTIAVVGAGLSGLGCALRLAQKKYAVTIFEKTDRIGGKLWNLLPDQTFLEDIERQFQHETYDLRLNTEIKDLSALTAEGFQAVYVATGTGGPDFGIVGGDDGHSMVLGETAFFAGGSLVGKDLMHSLAQGLDMAWSIEVFLKTQKLEYPEPLSPCKIVAAPEKLHPTPPVAPTEQGIFTEEECLAEAERCIRCQCDGCMTYCDVFAYHKKWPLKVRDEIMSTLASSESMLHKTPATRLLNTCTQCGLCDEVCTGGIEITKMMLDARRRLHKLDKMPGGYHQFWVNDMKFANGEFAAICKKAPGADSCNIAFFPGCQLGASHPRYVSETYDWLLKKDPTTGLLLRCCSVPAEWSGNEEMHQEEIRLLREDWESLGRPTLILACPACGRHLAEYLPEIPTISLYEVLAASDQKWSNTELTETHSIFDPCTARNQAPLEEAVRELCLKTGLLWEELPGGDKHGCCGYGGNVELANGDYADYVAKKRIQLSANPYLVYCINCRDIFEGEGKQVIHLLDLLFPIQEKGAPRPSLSQRRENRVTLKEQLLNKFWRENMESKPEPINKMLILSPEVRAKMERLKLLEEDIASVITFCESTGRQVFDPETEAFSCYRELGHVTCWIQYQKKDEEYHLLNVYSHRMKIKLEGVWNGKKTDTDLQ